MFEISHRAMACDFVVMVRDANQKVGHRSVADLVLDTLEEVDAVEKRLTVYRSTSEISAINQSAGGPGVCVSLETFRLLKKAQELSVATGGAFDITAGPLVEAWGFTERKGRKPTAAEIAEAGKLVGYEKLELDPSDHRVSLPEQGMRINLGGIGKGEAIDRIANRLKSLGIEDFLIHAGQSSVRACGNQFESASNFDEPNAIATENSPAGWLVGIAHPTKPNRRLAGIWLHDSALTTSGSGKQFFHHRGKRYGHVIDPRNGQPVGDLVSLSLLTDKAVEGDALATGLFVMGAEQAIEFSKRSDPYLPLILVAGGKRQDDVEVNTVGRWQWADPPAGWEEE